MFNVYTVDIIKFCFFIWQSVVLFDWKQGIPCHKWTGHTRDITKVCIFTK